MKPICLFDSGIGGLTVLRRLIENFPNEDYIYLADLANVPYGDKTRKEIKNIARGNIEWLFRFNPKLIIMACNTSSAILSTPAPKGRGSLSSAERQQSALSTQLGIPIYGVINSCAKKIANSRYSKVSVWATKLVVENNAYKKAINKLNSNIYVEEIACPKLVPMIEDLSFHQSDKQNILKEYLDQTSSDTCALILGCTHYPLIDNELVKLTSLKLIDPACSLIEELESHLIKDGRNTYEKEISIYSTAEVEKVGRFAKVYLCTNVCVKSVDLQKIKVTSA